MIRRCCVVLTGGPGGGKTSLIDDLARDPACAGRFAALPEAIFMMGQTGISPHERLFQRVMVRLQMALEDGLDRGLGVEDLRSILCHRGSLDPLAYWLQRGWPEAEFFAFTSTGREEHYRRYAAIIHLVTAADGAPWAYARWPAAHRAEEPDEAIRLDRLLEQAWSGHPHYFRLDNCETNWEEKSARARRILADLLSPD